MNLVDDLNPQQRAAVTLPDEPALILAGAGSGKTRVLTTRIAWLIQSGRTTPAGILAVTFTNKAAREMQTRLEAMLPVNPRGMWIGTFHGLCNRLLRAHHRDANLPETFQILDTQDQLSAIKRLIKAANVDEERCPPRDLQYFINSAKESGRRASDLGGAGTDRRWVELYAAYDAQCQREGCVDFAELLLRSVELLTRHEAIREHYRSRFRHILVDEFQDTNTLQYRWLKLLAGLGGSEGGPTGVPIFAVGDDDQSIYRFRGANVGNMSDFQREYAVRHLIKLEQNYRSHGNILDAANHLIGNNARRLGKKLWTDAGAGEKIHLFEAGSDGQEAAWIVDEVRDLQGRGARLQDVAILYRSNAQSRVIEHALFNAGMAYRVYGGMRFFERAEVKHALAYLRLAANPDDDISFARVVNFPPRGIGARSLEQLQDAARQAGTSLFRAIGTLGGRAGANFAQFAAIVGVLQEAAGRVTLAELVAEALQRSGLNEHYRNERDGADRLENLAELINAATGFSAEQARDLAREIGLDPGLDAGRNPGSTAADSAGDEADPRSTLIAFLAHASLEAGDNQASAGQDALQLMTVHAAKGLEFDSVFLTGLEEGLFPHENSLSEADGLEEERRLMYVAVTRARKRLSLSYAQSRMLHGQTRYGLRSRFVDELPEALLQIRTPRRGTFFGAGMQDRAPWGRETSQARPAGAVRGRGEIAGGRSAPFARPMGEAAGMSGNGMPPRSPLQAGGAATAAAESHGLRVGQGVRHAKFGEGIVVRLQGNGTDARAQINFRSVGVKELLLSVAKLQPA
ncbi:DNA helicase II [Burkholderiales bacterium GJ-E10]|nr:DNA helicase II [Burkholderiales bacterium GJ-E10]